MKMINMMESNTTPTPFIDKNPQIQFPYLHIYVTLFVMPESVRVEKGLAAEGAHQPHP